MNNKKALHVLCLTFRKADFEILLYVISLLERERERESRGGERGDAFGIRIY